MSQTLGHTWPKSLNLALSEFVWSSGTAEAILVYWHLGLFYFVFPFEELLLKVFI